MTNQLTAAEVREWRTETGMSQPDFGEMLDVSRSTVARWEENGGDRPLWLGLARDGWRARRNPSSELEEAVRRIVDRDLPKYLLVAQTDNEYRSTLESKGYVMDEVIGNSMIMRRDFKRVYSPVEVRTSPPTNPSLPNYIPIEEFEDDEVIVIENTKEGRRKMEAQGFIILSSEGNKLRMVRTKT